MTTKTCSRVDLFTPWGAENNRRQLAPPLPDRLQVSPERLGDEADRRAGQRQAALVDSMSGALGGLVVLRHTGRLPPGAGRYGDRSPLIGWAGCDHLAQAQAQALATVYIERKPQDG
jgi:hypothetical protein